MLIDDLACHLRGHGCAVDEGQGTPWAWTGRQFIAGQKYRDRQQITLIFTPTGNLELPINLWEAAGAHGWSPRRHGGEHANCNKDTLQVVDLKLLLRRQCSTMSRCPTHSNIIRQYTQRAWHRHTLLSGQEWCLTGIITVWVYTLFSRKILHNTALILCLYLTYKGETRSEPAQKIKNKIKGWPLYVQRAHSTVIKPFVYNLQGRLPTGRKPHHNTMNESSMRLFSVRGDTGEARLLHESRKRCETHWLALRWKSLQWKKKKKTRGEKSPEPMWIKTGQSGQKQNVKFQTAAGSFCRSWSWTHEAIIPKSTPPSRKMVPAFLLKKDL